MTRKATIFLDIITDKYQQTQPENLVFGVKIPKIENIFMSIYF